MIDFQDAKKIAGMMAAVSEPTRMLILHRLAGGPHHVGRLAELIGIPMVNMSHHLGVMRQAGILEDTKDGRRVVYSFRPGVFTRGTAPGTVGTVHLGGLALTLLDAPGNGHARANGTRKKKPAAKKSAGKTPRK
jgi:DNA-binding transcriptional ArsR family regulator